MVQIQFLIAHFFKECVLFTAHNVQQCAVFNKFIFKKLRIIYFIINFANSLRSITRCCLFFYILQLFNSA